MYKDDIYFKLDISKYDFFRNRTPHERITVFFNNLSCTHFISYFHNHNNNNKNVIDIDNCSSNCLCKQFIL